MFYGHLTKRCFSFPKTVKSLIKRLTIHKFFFFSSSYLQFKALLIIGNTVYILSDLDDVVQEVGFEKADPAFVEEEVALSVQARYQDSFPLVV